MAVGASDELGANQSPPFVGRNLLNDDCALREALSRGGVDPQDSDLAAFAAQCGSVDSIELGRLANDYPPTLHTHDARGARRDEVEFHPAWHALMRRDMRAGLHCSLWSGANPANPVASGHVARAARLFMATQAESGHICPLTMTSASVAALRREPDLLAQWLPRICGRDYDPAPRPWFEKSAVTLGMGMTELQGGTDVRANTTRARPVAGGYALDGAKWFLSAPMCDAFLVLAQAPGGLTTFLLPRFRPDGAPNGLRFERLKDKLGNRSNASSEATFADAYAWRVGPEGEGVRTIIEMVQLTRLDCIVASAGLMRFALAQAAWHCLHRRVFQRRLIDQPLMRAVLADLALEVEGATALAFALADAFERADLDPEAAACARLITPAAKFLVCRAAPNFVFEAMECLGGNGYVEEWPLARAYREAPVNAIWEGSGNVMALDVLRAAARAPEAAGALVDRLARRCGLADAAPGIAADMRGGERLARRACERLARLAATAALVDAQPTLASAYAASRLGGGATAQLGARDLEKVEDLLIARISGETVNAGR